MSQSTTIGVGPIYDDLVKAWAQRARGNVSGPRSARQGKGCRRSRDRSVVVQNPSLYICCARNWTAHLGDIEAYRNLRSGAVDRPVFNVSLEVTWISVDVGVLSSHIAAKVEWTCSCHQRYSVHFARSV